MVWSSFNPLPKTQSSGRLRFAVITVSLLAALAAFGPINRGDSRRPSAQQVRPAAAAKVNSTPAAIVVDYPLDGSIFPPEITPPTFIWRDPGKASLWQIDVAFDDRSKGIRTVSKGERMRIGEIDPDCIAETNRLPRLTPRQAAARTWVPDATTWKAIKERSVAGPAKVTIAGFLGPDTKHPISRGHVTIRTSKDPVGAPIFYRDVPLMPSETEKGVIKPLAPYAVRLIRWRLRNVGEPQSRVVLEKLPVCANCHSFSLDGKTLGMDLDGLQNNKGLYTLTPVKPQMSVGRANVIQWSTARGKLQGNIRVGFMSQVSPDGRFVVTTIDGSEANEESSITSLPNAKSATSNYYVANFKDYRFLQVFYPTRGNLAWYSRETGILKPLPGADDPRYVQMGGVWSPDGKYLVFARAEAKDPYPDNAPLAKFSNDPNERQIQYDLYRIPFNDGRGGVAEPIDGASRNGMSNSFPKVSPDGRWIVFVQCRNGLLMRPDSQLFIVPAAGGQARRMRCNTSLMNSWHSFSPNGRWLVFSSKSRSPYTQMYLTHIDEDGNDSPAILVENSTAANRAVNIPEFVNIPPDGLQSIGGPALEYYRLVDEAAYWRKKGQYETAAAEWRKALEIKPDDALGYSNLGALLLLLGRPQEAAAQLKRAKEIRLDDALAQLRKRLEFEPASAPAHYNLGLVLAEKGETAEALRQWQKTLELDPGYAEAHESLGNALYAQGDVAEALAHWREELRLQPNTTSTLQRAAWVLATCPERALRDGEQALTFARRAAQLTHENDPAILDALAAAYAEVGRFTDAASTARKALALATQRDMQQQIESIRKRVELYEARTPFRENCASSVPSTRPRRKGGSV